MSAPAGPWMGKPAASLPVTPSQTVGPFLAIGLPWPDGPCVVPQGSPGSIVITGRVLDVAGDPVPDALVETWQADQDSGFGHPDDPRGSAGGSGWSSPRASTVLSGFRGFGRCPTDAQGRYRIVTVKPGPLPCPDGGTEAPHLDVSVFARGLLDRVVTRIYFPDEAEANEADPVLASIADPRRRATLVAVAEPAAQGGQAGPAGQGCAYRFDIRLRGNRETVFFDV